MESIISYIILLVVGLGVLYAYRWRKSTLRELPLSIQYFPEIILSCLVKKQEGKIQDIILRIEAKKEIFITRVYIELITSGRKVITLAPKDTDLENAGDLLVKKGSAHHFRFNPSSLKEKVSEHADEKATFRLVAESKLGKKFKTHELAFNKNWSVYKPDSGRYN